MTFSRSARLSTVALLLVLSACGSLQSVRGTDVASASAAGRLSAIRQASGLSAATPDRALEKAALQQARYMAETGRMEHTTGRGRDFTARMADNGIKTAAAENIAHGAMDMDRLFAMWNASPPHRKNMLDPRFDRFGLASATDASGRRYWALVLGE